MDSKKDNVNEWNEDSDPYNLMFERFGTMIPEHKRIVLVLMKYGVTPVKTWKLDIPIRAFYFTVRSFLMLIHKPCILPVDLLRFLHTFIIG
jgi:hypothetical protein